MEKSSEKVFRYDTKDFIVCTKYSTKKEESPKSQFEESLCSLWDNAMKNGAFWYSLDKVKTKLIPGKHKFVAQLNEKRFAQRRKPESATKVEMPYNANKFNFNKVKDNEILMVLKCNQKESDNVDEIVINVSPIVYGHVLLVPNVTACQPQVLDVHGIETAVSTCLLTTDRNFCIGFNSLCALASVNHQHFHASYVGHDIPLDRLKVRHLTDQVSVFDDYIVNGFIFQLHNTDIQQFSRTVWNVTSWLSKNNIAHNIYMSRQSNLIEQDIEPGFYVTLCLFPKKPCQGMKDTRSLNSSCYDLAGYILTKEVLDYPFNPAAFEMPGFLPVRNLDGYNSLTEDAILEILKRYTFTDDEFQDLCHKMMSEINWLPSDATV